MKVKRFFAELKRRNMIRAVIAYLAVSWLLVQIASIIFPAFDFPDYAIKILIYILAIGLFIWIVFSWIYDWTSKGWQKTSELTGTYAEKIPGRGFLIFFIFFVAFLMLGGWYIWKMGYDQPRQEIKSLAVLPFDNLSEQPDQEAFVSGLQDNLITTLSQIRSLRIISRTSTLKYEDTEHSMKEIATELDVDALIESSVLKVGDSVRINFQLIQVFPVERHLWARNFDRPVDDNVLKMFNELTKLVAKEIHLELSPKEASFLNDSKPVHPEALKAYLRGKYQLEKLSPEGFRKALEFFEKAISIDPEYAPVYAEVANSYIYMLQMRMIIFNKALPKIYEYNNKALEKDPNLSEANFTTALIKWFEWDWEACENKFQQFLSDNPNHALGNAFYGHLLMLQMRSAEAIPYMDRAIALDPMNDLLFSLKAFVLLNSGRNEEAGEMLVKSMELNPRNMLTLRAMEAGTAANRDLEGSIEFLDKIYSDIYQLDLDLKTYFKNYGYKKSILHLCKTLENEMNGQDFYIALFYHRIGQFEKSIEWLLESYENHDVDIPYLFVGKGLDNVINDPRIVAISKKVGLPN